MRLLISLTAFKKHEIYFWEWWLILFRSTSPLKATKYNGFFFFLITKNIEDLPRLSKQSLSQN